MTFWMILRTLLLLAATVTMTSRVVAAPVPTDRHILHHCEHVVARADKTAQSTKALRTDAAELDRCQMVIREFVSRESRMPVDENGKTVR